MFFPVTTKNVNWEIFTKNLVTFKRWDGVNNEKFQYYGCSLKNPFFGGGGGRGFMNIEGNCLKRGSLGIFQI